MGGTRREDPDDPENAGEVLGAGSVGLIMGYVSGLLFGRIGKAVLFLGGSAAAAHYMGYIDISKEMERVRNRTRQGIEVDADSPALEVIDFLTRHRRASLTGFTVGFILGISK
jgi:hypothetical protein